MKPEIDIQIRVNNSSSEEASSYSNTVSGVLTIYVTTSVNPFSSNSTSSAASTTPTDQSNSTSTRSATTPTYSNVCDNSAYASVVPGCTSASQRTFRMGKLRFVTLVLMMLSVLPVLTLGLPDSQHSGAQPAIPASLVEDSSDVNAFVGPSIDSLVPTLILDGNLADEDQFVRRDNFSDLTCGLFGQYQECLCYAGWNCKTLGICCVENPNNQGFDGNNTCVEGTLGCYCSKGERCKWPQGTPHQPGTHPPKTCYCLYYVARKNDADILALKSLHGVAVVVGAVGLWLGLLFMV